MKKVYALILMLLMFAGYASAQESDDVYYLGYCNGEINTLGTGKSGECIVSAAIMIPKEETILSFGFPFLIPSKKSAIITYIDKSNCLTCTGAL